MMASHIMAECLILSNVYQRVLSSRISGRNFTLLIVRLLSENVELLAKIFVISGQLISQSSRKAGTTNLHIDVSDAINVLVYVGVGGHGEDGSDTQEELQRK